MQNPQPEEVLSFLMIYFHHAHVQGMKPKHLFRQAKQLYEHLVREGLFLGLVDCALKYMIVTRQDSTRNQSPKSICTSILHFSSEELDIGVHPENGILSADPFTYTALFPRAAAAAQRIAQQRQKNPSREGFRSVLDNWIDTPKSRKKSKTAASKRTGDSISWYIMAHQAPSLRIEMTDMGYTPPYPEYDKMNMDAVCSKFASDVTKETGTQSNAAVIPTMLTSCSADEATRALKEAFDKTAIVKSISIVSHNACDCSQSRDGLRQKCELGCIEACSACASKLVKRWIESKSSEAQLTTLVFVLATSSSTNLDDEAYNRVFDELSRNLFKSWAPTTLTKGENLQRLMRQRCANTDLLSTFRSRMAARSIHIQMKKCMIPGKKIVVDERLLRLMSRTVSEYDICINHDPVVVPKRTKNPKACVFWTSQAIFFAMIFPADKQRKLEIKSSDIQAFWLMSFFVRLRTIIQLYSMGLTVKTFLFYVSTFKNALNTLFLNKTEIEKRCAVLTNLNPNSCSRKRTKRDDKRSRSSVRAAQKKARVELAKKKLNGPRTQHTPPRNKGAQDRFDDDVSIVEKGARSVSGIEG